MIPTTPSALRLARKSLSSPSTMAPIGALPPILEQPIFFGEFRRVGSGEIYADQDEARRAHRNIFDASEMVDMRAPHASRQQMSEAFPQQHSRFDEDDAVIWPQVRFARAARQSSAGETLEY
jgi:hypothetical protein